MSGSRDCTRICGRMEATPCSRPLFTPPRQARTEAVAQLSLPPGWPGFGANNWQLRVRPRNRAALWAFNFSHIDFPAARATGRDRVGPLSLNCSRD